MFRDLSLGSVDVVDGRQQLLTGLLVDVRAEADVDQVGQLLHGVLLQERDTVRGSGRFWWVLEGSGGVWRGLGWFSRGSEGIWRDLVGSGGVLRVLKGPELVLEWFWKVLESS